MEKVRISVDCTPEERKQIKLMATICDKTISEWVMQSVRSRLKRTKEHIPNAESSLALKESASGEGVQSYSCLEDLFDDLEI
ncbi:hypothetical protein SCG7086_BX_00040 [Chlamydiales bacterium SCGC AG-110-P3]|nr:hypothetical protein SCG7086_BX_00040 [Chlamydiales bacterium SCGC AG-110-P3]